MHNNWDTEITQCETQKNCVAKMSRIMLVQQKKLQSFVIYNLCTVMSCIMLTAPRGSVGFWHLSTIIKKRKLHKCLILERKTQMSNIDSNFFSRSRWNTPNAMILSAIQISLQNAIFHNKGPWNVVQAEE